MDKETYDKLAESANFPDLINLWSRMERLEQRISELQEVVDFFKEKYRNEYNEFLEARD